MKVVFVEDNSFHYRDVRIGDTFTIKETLYLKINHALDSPNSINLSLTAPNNIVYERIDGDCPVILVNVSINIKERS
jgi:hypothetical protein